MAACASPLRLLGVGLMGGTLGGQTVLSVTEGTGRASFGPSLLAKATPHLLRLQFMKQFMEDYSRTRAPLGHDPGTMKDVDVAVELFLHEGKIKTPYERDVAFFPCLFARWYDPDCVPGIGSKIYTDNPLSDEEMQQAILASVSAGGPDVHQMASFSRPYMLVIHGNDQYVAVYPDAEEIGPGHPHRERVERHFAERGLNHLTETPPVDWGKLYGQDSNPGGSGQAPSGLGLTTSLGELDDARYFRDKLFRGLGVPREFFIRPHETGFIHRPETENPDGGKPTG